MPLTRVEKQTRQLRSAEGGAWEGLRALLRQQGIDPLRSALAILYRDDVGLLLAVVVASAETMMEVEIEYPADLDESQAMEAGRIGDWSADAERIAAENRDCVEAALRLLSETLA